MYQYNLLCGLNFYQLVFIWDLSVCSFDLPQCIIKVCLNFMEDLPVPPSCTSAVHMMDQKYEHC